MLSLHSSQAGEPLLQLFCLKEPHKNDHFNAEETSVIGAHHNLTTYISYMHYLSANNKTDFHLFNRWYIS